MNRNARRAANARARQNSYVGVKPPLLSAPTIHSTGSQSPFGVLPVDGAKLSIGPGGLVMVIQFSNPSSTEIADLRRGKMQIGLLQMGGTGILLTRFGKAPEQLGDTARCIVLECPFHIGLELPSNRHLPDRPAGKTLALTLILQDQFGRQHGGRQIGLDLPMVTSIEKIVADQAHEAASSNWSRAVHDAEVMRFYSQCPDLAAAAERLLGSS